MAKCAGNYVNSALAVGEAKDRGFQEGLALDVDVPPAIPRAVGDAGRIRQTVYRGLKRVDQHFKLTMTASNLIRLARMLGAVPTQVGL